jgi:rRNA maturation protein Nop10
MHKYIFLLPLLAFTFSCNASATKSFSLVMPLSVSGDSTVTPDPAGFSPVDTEYTGVGFRYEAKSDSVGLGVEFTPSATYTWPDMVWLVDGSTPEFSGTEIGVFARKYLADDTLFLEAGTMLGLGLESNDPTGTLPESSGYTNLKLAVGSRVDFGESMFGEASAGLIQTIVPVEYDDGSENSISAFGISAGIGINF